MKQLILKTGDVPAKGDEPMTYGMFVRACLDKPPATGFSRADLRERDRIEKALDAANGTLELEDADVDVLKKLMNDMRWGIRNAFVLEFCDEVEAL